MHAFFVQLEPDIDHITPIVHTLVKSGERAVVVNANVLYETDADYRLCYLRDDLGVPVDYAHRLARGQSTRYAAMRAMLKLPGFILDRYPAGQWKRFYFEKTAVSETWVANFIDKFRPKTITFDYGIPVGVKAPVAKVARERGITVVMCPHGHHNVTVQLTSSVDFTFSDYNIVLRSCDVPPGKENPRSAVLGCMRYCREWQEINTRLLDKRFPGRDLPGTPGKLKVLVLGRGLGNLRGDDETCRRIRGLDFVELIYKDKPRTTRPSKCFYTGWNAYPTARLIRWADVVVSSISSVILDIFHFNKVFLFPKYLSPAEDGVFEKYGVCCTLDSVDRMVEVLGKLHSDRSYRPYRQEDVDRFVRHAIHRDGEVQDVLANYANFYRVVQGDSPAMETAGSRAVVQALI